MGSTSTSANRIIEAPQILLSMQSTGHLLESTLKDILSKNSLFLIKQYTLIMYVY